MPTETTTATATATTETLKVKKEKKPLDLVTIVGKQVINKWAHEHNMNVGSEVFPSINQFVLALDWRSVLQFNAPEGTPDIGVVFSRLNALISQNLDAHVQVSDAKRAARNLSFLIWCSLNAVKDLLATIKRKRLSFDFVFPVLLAAYNTSLAAIGAPPAAIEIKLPEKPPKQAAEVKPKAEEGEEVKSEQIEQPPAKKKKTGGGNSKNIPSNSMVTIEDPMVVH